MLNNIHRATSAQLLTQDPDRQADRVKIETVVLFKNLPFYLQTAITAYPETEDTPLLYLDRQTDRWTD